MQRAVLCLVLIAILGMAIPAGAVICTIDDVPAATLLLPYFEVDLANGNGITTLFSVNNASASFQRPSSIAKLAVHTRHHPMPRGSSS